MQLKRLHNPLRFSLCRQLISGLAVTLFCMLLPAANAGGHVRLSDGENDYEGKIVALSGSHCSVMDKQGKLIHLKVKSLKKFDKVSPRYQPYSSSAFRQELSREFPGYQVVGSTRYLVVAPRGQASRYAKLFDTIYRDVEQFFRVRGFKVTTPEVPLVAVVFGSQQEFARYCLKDSVPPSQTLMGYYSLLSNRVALFDTQQAISTVDPSLQFRSERYSSILAAAGISQDTANTIIHETTHQVGYNIGVHSRLGTTPVWLVEGLATALEPNGMRESRGRKLLSDRLNPERAQWFAHQHRSQRQAGYFAKMVASDDFFYRQTLNSYSESWALTFFLLENNARRKQLVSYIQQLSNRTPSGNYTAKQRLADFQSAFGDISRLEIEFLRYMDSL